MDEQFDRSMKIVEQTLRRTRSKYEALTNQELRDELATASKIVRAITQRAGPPTGPWAAWWGTLGQPADVAHAHACAAIAVRCARLLKERGWL